MAQDSDINELSAEEQARQERRAEASKQMEAFVKQVIGQTVGTIEETLKRVETLVGAQTELIRLIDNRVEQLELRAGKPVDLTEQILQVTETPDGTETVTRIAEKSIRLRMGHTISTKGIHQFEGTVEGTNLSQQEIMAARLEMDVDLRRLQPDYEEFVEPSSPAPIESEAVAPGVETPAEETPVEPVVEEPAVEQPAEEEPVRRGPGRPPNAK